MSFIDELASKRRKLLEGLDANEGDINLRIFEDFYPDKAHFIYELLQNAEDAEATEASFELNPDGCALVHNGPRHFDENDIKSITGIFNSSKKNNSDKIGKFGVGFKSVFVYTDTPIIYSKNYSFKISQLILPETIPKIDGLGEQTRFEFPFNNSKMNAKQAFSEIKAGLEQLSETTLLFLNNIRCINWKIGSLQGAVLREEHSDVHIEVENSKVVSSHWLRFTAPVDGLERQKVAVVYELAFLGDKKTFDPKQPLCEQLKIIPAKPGLVAVFFPAEKETSGLRFHLHAPFVPELSRASIKNSPANQPLFEQLARLAAGSLHGVKNLGLLTGEFLAVLPNNDETLPERYRSIRGSMIQEMREHPLTPTQSKGHAPAKTLLQARAALKELLSDDDLAFLFPRKDNPTWAIGATQQNSKQDQFLKSLDITAWDVDNLVNLLRERASETLYSWKGRLDPEIMKWLGSKSDEWHQQLYATIYRSLAKNDDFSALHDAKIVRLEDGAYSTAGEAYFPSGHANASDPFPRVSESVLTIGTRKDQQAYARKLLEELGVSEVGEAEEIDLILKQRYAKTSIVPTEDVYLADLKRFIAFMEKNPTERQKFKGAFLFKLEQYKRGTPAAVYLDEPLKKTGLRYYHGSLPDGKCKKWALSKWYLNCGIEQSKLIAFAEATGCSTTFLELTIETQCWKFNPKWDYLQQVPGERHTTPIDRDYTIPPVIYDLLQSKNEEFSRLVWRTMCSLKSSYLSAEYQKNVTGKSRQAESTLIHQLRQAEWIPLKDGRFVKPRNASREGLLSGFTFDLGYKWLELVQFGEDEKKTSAEHTARSQKRADLGFETDEALERAQAFSKLPQEEQERVLEEHRTRISAPPEDFPVKPVRNKDLRNQRVQDQASQTPNKEIQIRPRAVAIGYEAVKDDAKMYLREQYTNENGVMFCQVCKSALPFLLPSGMYYFEAVETVDCLSKRFRETFLALCPNHAAMFKLANDQTTCRSCLKLRAGSKLR